MGVQISLKFIQQDKFGGGSGENMGEGKKNIFSYKLYIKN